MARAWHKVQRQCNLTYKMWGNHFFKSPLKIPCGQIARMSPFHPFFNMIHPRQGVWEYQGAMVLGMRLKKENRSRKSTSSPPPQSSQGLQSPETCYKSMFHNLLTGENLQLINHKTNPFNPLSTFS